MAMLYQLSYNGMISQNLRDLKFLERENDNKPYSSCEASPSGEDVFWIYSSFFS